LTNKRSKLYKKSRRHSSRLAYCHVSWDTLYQEFRSDFNLFKYNKNCRNLNEILQIFVNIESKTGADHILKMPILGIF